MLAGCSASPAFSAPRSRTCAAEGVVGLHLGQIGVVDGLATRDRRSGAGTAWQASTVRPPVGGLHHDDERAPADSTLGEDPTAIIRPPAVECRGVSCPRGQGTARPRDRGSRGHRHQPVEGVLPGRGLHEGRCRPLLPGGRRRRAGRDPLPADGPQAVRGRDRQGAVLPEARTGQHAGVAARPPS